MFIDLFNEWLQVTISIAFIASRKQILKDFMYCSIKILKDAVDFDLVMELEGSQTRVLLKLLSDLVLNEKPVRTYERYSTKLEIIL